VYDTLAHVVYSTPSIFLNYYRCQRVSIVFGVHVYIGAS